MRLARQSLRNEVGRLLTGDEVEQRPVFFAAGNRFCLVWSCDLSSNSIQTVLISFTPPEYEELTPVGLVLQMYFQKYRSCFGHPLLLGIMFADVLRLEVMSVYTADSQRLREIASTVTIKSASRVETIQKLRELGYNAAEDKYNLLAVQKLIEICSKASDEFTVPDSVRRHAHLHLDQQRSMTQLDIYFLERVLESVNNQQSAISCIVSMQDNTSMKTLAVVSMLFLPGTFAASLFAMPMFVYDDAASSFVTKQFWLYWAAAIPLTITVVLVWLSL